MKIGLFVLAISLLSPVLRADEWTHQLGNSGYAVREAMHAGANKSHNEQYQEAVQWQKKARNLFSQFNRDESMDASRKAEDLAKKLR